MTHAVRKAVFPVAGLGTRFLPATKAIAKEMLPVVDKPLIQYAVEEAVNAGIEYVIFVTGRGKSVLMDHFDHAPELESMLRDKRKSKALEEITRSMPEAGRVLSVRQQEPLGLGHAVWCARAFVGEEPFAVILPDDLILGDQPAIGQLMDAHDRVGGNVVAVEEVPDDRTHQYGILDIDNETDGLSRARGLVEKPKPDMAPSTRAIIGRYVLDPRIFDYLETQERGSGGEVQLTDALNRMIPEAPFHGLNLAGRRYDCGDKVGFLEANLAFSLHHPELGERTKAMLESYVKGG